MGVISCLSFSIYTTRDRQQTSTLSANIKKTKMWTVLAVLCLATGALARKQFIVGGADVDIADYPWQGSYRTGSGSHTCGCVFVGGSWAITAAHCGGSSTYSMEFGGTDRGSGTVFGITSVVENPDYGSGPGFSPNDIAVVEASSQISGTNISPATMSTDAGNPGGNGWITGWGRTCGGCALPTTLQGTEIPIIDDATCDAQWGGSFNSDNMICVWDGPDGTIGSCNGDSGGPLSVGSTVYGVTSWGVSGCGTNYPSVYTKVGPFQSWACGETNNEAAGC